MLDVGFTLNGVSHSVKSLLKLLLLLHIFVRVVSTIQLPQYC